MILADPDDKQSADHWSVYYHVFLSKTSHDRLQEQTKKLHALASTLEAWRASEYGNLIRFCDEGSLMRVAKVWEFYISAAAERQAWLKKEFQAAVKMRNQCMTKPSAISVAGFHSATPAFLLPRSELDELRRFFWNHGALDLDSSARAQATYANPTFATPDPCGVLHNAVDPLLGFHLAAAYVPLDSSSPLHRGPGRKTKLVGVIAVAKIQFSLWSKAFRAAANKGHLVLRCFVGDAFPFCYTLQHRHKTGSATTAHWYRDHNTMDPLLLIGDDYGPGGTAPVSFNVIDTSSLVDHAGAINVLVAASPLLDGDFASTLYTESLARLSVNSQQEHIEQLLGPHLASVSLLVGLFPVEHWTNTSPVSVGDDELIGTQGSNGTRTQLCSRVTWKRSPCASGSMRNPLHIAKDDLVAILYRVHGEMFRSEQIVTRQILPTQRSVQRASSPSYTRAGFATFLSLVKSRIVTSQWDEAMDALCTRLESEPAVLLGVYNHVRELQVYMHIWDVYSVPLVNGLSVFYANLGVEVKDLPGLASWHNVPPSVCVTLKVPRSALDIFTKIQSESVGSIPVHAVVRDLVSGSAGLQNRFAAVHLCFGTLSTSGTPSSSSFQLSIHEDPQAWHGSCPLFVSFRVPSCVLLFGAAKTLVSFHIDRTPTTHVKFGNTLDVELTVFDTTLSDASHAFVSKDLPNQKGAMRVPGFANVDLVQPEPAIDGATISITATFEPATKLITGLVARLTLVSDPLRSDLSSGKQVQVTTLSPCVVVVAIGETSVPVIFPIPILPGTKTVVARKTGYISVTGSIVTPAAHPSASFTAPVFFPAAKPNHPSIPVCWATPYVSPSRLDVIATPLLQKPSFLTFHVDQMFSRREALLRRNTVLKDSARPAQRARLGFKETLRHMFLAFCGLVPRGDTGTEHAVFAVTGTIPGLTILLFVSSLRFDAARRTVLLDCAMLELTQSVLASFTDDEVVARAVKESRGGTSEFIVGEEEMQVWREVLPAWVERARGGAWSHREGCEYRGCSAPVGPEMDGEVVCRCGRGVFPAGWAVADSPMWEVVKGSCVQAAITPVFASALAEDLMVDIQEVLAVSAPRVPEGASITKDGVTRCRNCGKAEGKDDVELKSCSKCLKVKYCGRACQRADWKRHKKECSESTKEKSG